MPKKSLKMVAYEYLYTNIISNNFPPNEPIVEQEISNRLGISRTPIREALKQLEAKGLIVHIPKRGVFVQEITIQDIEEIFSLREALELLALKKAINNIPDEEIAKLIQKLEKLNQNSNFEDFYDSDRELHDLIVKYGYNKRLSDILNNLNDQIERLRRISSRTPKRLEKSKQEHMEIVQAIKKRDITAASKLLTEHIRNVKESVLNIYHTYRTY